MLLSPVGCLEVSIRQIKMCSACAPYEESIKKKAKTKQNKTAVLSLNLVSKSHFLLLPLKPQSKRVTGLNTNFTISTISRLAVCVVAHFRSNRLDDQAHIVVVKHTGASIPTVYISSSLTQRRAGEKLSVCADLWSTALPNISHHPAERGWRAGGGVGALDFLWQGI